jgi:hypothetical protein
MRPEGPEHPAPGEDTIIRLIDSAPGRRDLDHFVHRSQVAYYLKMYPNMRVAPGQGMGKPRKCRKCGGYKVSPR